MSDMPDPSTVDRWHRYFAVECNNRAWDLVSRADLTPAETVELRDVAHASAFHWAKVGKPINAARADLTLSHAYARLADSSAAMAYARRCLAFCESNRCEDWDLAFASAAVAQAAAMLGDVDLHAHYHAEARARGAAIADPEDRAQFEAEFARVPESVEQE